MKTKIYLDTSVFGGYFDSEFEEESKSLFDKIENGEFDILISDILEDELTPAPADIRQLAKRIPSHCFIKIKSDERVENLAKAYIDAGVVSKKHFFDTMHIACATVFGAHALISWNFKHIVNFDRIKGYDLINFANDYRAIKILSPKSFIY